MKSKLKLALLILGDIIVINASFVLALLLRFDLSISNSQFLGYFDNTYIRNAIAITLINLIAIWSNKLYVSLWRYASLRELVSCGVAALSGTAGVIAYLALIEDPLPRSVSLIAMVIEAIALTIERFSYRIFRDVRRTGFFDFRRSEDETRVLLVGAGNAGLSMIKEFKLAKEKKYRVVAVIDDSKEKIGQEIQGVKIVGDRNTIEEMTERYDIDEIVIAIPTASKKAISELVDICQRTGKKVQILPAIAELLDGRVSAGELRDVALEDLLGRDPIKLNLKNIAGYIQGQTVLVTGGAGSIGSELVRQVANYAPKKIYIFDIYENTSFELEQEMREKFPHLPFAVEIGSIADKTRVCELFKTVKPNVVFHAAAHKHVPLMEDNAREALVNNVIGTKNLLDAAKAHGVSNFILISTDKAVNPTSVMGASKRICEMLLQEYAKDAGCGKFVAVRFGNVLGSNGSVVPTFKKQIAKGGPVTVTHKDITRFFMTIPEAVQLVLQAGSMAKGGEIFILDMGEPVKILDLAEKLIRLSGSEPYKDIEIKFTGLRPGEKLFEELLLSEEGIEKTSHEKIFIGQPVPASEGLKNLLEIGLEKELERRCSASDDEIRAWIKEIVPNYLGGH